MPPGRDPRDESPIKDLAPDAWKELPALPVFQARLQAGSSVPVKAALLDQNKIVSGIGNWVRRTLVFELAAEAFASNPPTHSPIHSPTHSPIRPPSQPTHPPTTPQVADEVLYQSKVDPAKKCTTLTAQEIQAIHHNIHYVCETACHANAQSETFPPDWLFHFRWTNKAKVCSSMND